jgi:excisionase family DNA binding protein
MIQARGVFAVENATIVSERLAAVADELRRLAADLRVSGNPEWKRVRAAADALGQPPATASAAEPVLLTTGEAARRLGVRSINTIKRWAREGRLEGYQRGTRILVSQRSVDALAQSPTVAAERTYERERDAALAEFDAGDEPVEPIGLTTAGRKPWAASVAPASV